MTDERAQQVFGCEASQGGWMGQGWLLEVGRARVGALLGDG